MMAAAAIVRMGTHWLRVLDSSQGWLARDHIAQTMRLAAQSPATWTLAARLALRLHPVMMRAGLYAMWARDLSSVLAHPPSDQALALEVRAALGATLIAGAQWEEAREHLTQVQRAYRQHGNWLGGGQATSDGLSTSVINDATTNHKSLSFDHYHWLKVAQAEYDLAALAWNRGEWRRSVWLARTAIRRVVRQATRDAAARHLYSRALDLIGLALWRMETPRRALRYLQRALALRAPEDQRGVGHVHHHLMLVYTALGDAEAALEHAAQARALFEACADREGLAYVWSDVSDVYRLQNDVARAREALARAYALWRELQDPAGLADFYRHLGLVETLAGEYATARAHLAYARQLWSTIGEPREVARCDEALHAMEEK